MAPVSLDNRVGPRPDPLYNKGSLEQLSTGQNDDNARDEDFHAHIHAQPSQEATPESRSYQARLHATTFKEGDQHQSGRRVHALKGNEQNQERSYSDGDLNPEEETDRATDVEDTIVYRVCQYSTGSRYGYLIDHCPEHQQSAPQDHPQVAPRARHTQMHSYAYAAEKSSGVRVNLTLGSMVLVLVFLLLVAIMLVELVDIISHARETSPETKRRGRNRTRRALERVFGAPRKLFIDNAKKETIGLKVALES